MKGSGAAPAAVGTIQPPIMKGGSQAHLTDLAKKFEAPIKMYVLVGLILAITFVKQIPIAIRSQAGSTLGRLFLFAATLAMAEYYSWTNGLLMAVLSLLLLSMAPRPSREGFESMPANLKLITNSKKWFVEQVLKENPVAIEEENVRTSAVQDSSNSSRTSAGSTK